MNGRALLHWYTSLVKHGAKSLWMDREVFDALMADTSIRWTPYKPNWEDVKIGQPICTVEGVPVVRGD